MDHSAGQPENQKGCREQPDWQDALLEPVKYNHLPIKFSKIRKPIGSTVNFAGMATRFPVTLIAVLDSIVNR